MLYRGKMQSDVERERNLTMYQLSQVKSITEKQTLGV